MVSKLFLRFLIVAMFMVCLCTGLLFFLLMELFKKTNTKEKKNHTSIVCNVTKVMI